MLTVQHRFTDPQVLNRPGDWPQAWLPADGWWVPPRRVVVTTGVARGGSELNAFDNALLAAGIGDLNLLRVTSVLPPSAEIVNVGGSVWSCPIPPGALVPVVYGEHVTAGPGKAAAAVGLGIPVDGAHNGMIFEASLEGSAAQAEAEVRRMVAEAFRVRGRGLRETLVAASEIEVTEGHGCALACVVFLPTSPERRDGQGRDGRETQAR